MEVVRLLMSADGSGSDFGRHSEGVSVWRCDQRRRDIPATRSQDAI
jgi:hypothetical protein